YQLTRSVRRALRAARLGFDRKPFRPHLTIARPGDRLPATDLAADLAALAGYQGPVWPAERLRLVRSCPGPKPVHEPVAEFLVASTHDGR
ncbi:MAG: 2'-5' RNA ligase family protein, partial [Natronosporangium sp.]